MKIHADSTRASDIEKKALYRNGFGRDSETRINL